MQSYFGENASLDSLAAGFTGLMSSNSGGDAPSSASSPPDSESTSPAAAPSTSGGLRLRDRDLSFVSFNQDNTSLAVGTINGYKLYSLNSNDNLECIYENNSEEVLLAERLFSSSLVAVVSKAAPRKLRVCHFKKGTEICTYSYSSKILSVKMNRARLVVCLEEALYVHNIRDMKVLHTIRETPPNPTGLCALSPAGGDDQQHCYLAYPGSSSVGEIQMFDTVNLSSKGMISAHATQLAAVSFSATGAKIASASEKGTVIRVFATHDGAKLYELRRGLKRTVNIYSLSFSPCGHYLSCSSNTETVHVFKLEDGPSSRHVAGGGSGGDVAGGQSPPGGSSASPATGSSAGSSSSGGAGEGWLGYLNTVVSASASYLPAQVTDALLQGRAFATVHHNQPGMINLCALATIKRCLRLLVASHDGFLYLYSLNLEEGGDCNLMRQFHLMANGKGDGSNAGVSIGNYRAAARKSVVAGSSGSDGEGGGSGDDVHDKAAQGGDVSYADRVKNRSRPSEMTESEKFHEMKSATEVPPQQCFLLDDDGEFPPMGQQQHERR